MNQEVIAGVGNELSDEVLWRAGIHPRRRAQGTVANRTSYWCTKEQPAP